jgi:hypothetical protein
LVPRVGAPTTNPGDNSSPGSLPIYAPSVSLDLFAALADGPLAPANGGVFTGRPDPTQTPRVDIPGLNSLAAFPLAVLSIQTVNNVGASTESNGASTASGAARLLALGDHLLVLASLKGLVSPWHAAEDVVIAFADVLEPAAEWWDSLGSPSINPNGTLAVATGGEPTVGRISRPDGSGSGEREGFAANTLPDRRPLRSWVWTWAFGAIALALVGGRRLARRFRARTRPPSKRETA